MNDEKTPKRVCYDSTNSHCAFCGLDLLNCLRDYLSSGLVRTAPPGASNHDVNRTKAPACGECLRIAELIGPLFQKYSGLPAMRAAIDKERQRHLVKWAFLRWHAGRDQDTEHVEAVVGHPVQAAG